MGAEVHWGLGVRRVGGADDTGTGDWAGWALGES